MDQPSELALIDDGGKVFGLCPDHQEQKTCEDPDYKTVGQGRETRAPNVEVSNKQMSNVCDGLHVDASMHKFVPT